MNQKTLLKALIALAACTTYAIDNPHFWRATNFLPQFYEPRLAKSWLTSLDIFVGYGATHTSRNSQNQTVPLLALDGAENIPALARGLPNLNLTNPVDMTLQNLSLLSCPCDFGQLEYCGKYKITEANFCFTQNINCGFFWQLHFPVRDMSICNITMIDESVNGCSGNPNQANIYWQTFLNLYPQFLSQFDLIMDTSNTCTANGTTGNIKISGIGDTTVLLGWTYNYEDSPAVDFVDFTLRTGILAPTGKKKNPAIVFDLPNGYNGHIGIPVSFNFAVGYYEWLTMGAFVGATLFVKKEETVRVHTDPSQNGFIKLLTINASVHEGTIWQALGYLKADHFAGGFSFWTTYFFTLQQRTVLNPNSTTYVTASIINADSTLAGWNMHTVNLMLEYDFTKECNAFGPRIGIFGNIQVAGSRIFKTDMAGGFFGFDFSWCF